MSILSKVRPYGSHQRMQTANLSITIRCESHRHKINSLAIKQIYSYTLPAKHCHE